MGRPVVHFEIHSRDAAKAKAFYAELFDWRIQSDNPMNYGLVETGAGSGINGGIMGGQEHTGVIFYVEVDDLQAYLDRAEAMGGKTLMPPTEVPGTVTFALFADLDGNPIGLVKSWEGAAQG